MRSVQAEEDGDKTCEVAMLDMESSALMNGPNSPVIGGQTCMKGIKRQLVFATTPEDRTLAVKSRKNIRRKQHFYNIFLLDG